MHYLPSASEAHGAYRASGLLSPCELAAQIAGTPFQFPAWAVGGLSAFLCLPYLRWRRICLTGQFLVSH